jgi:hypothetical protein
MRRVVEIMPEVVSALVDRQQVRAMGDDIQSLSLNFSSSLTTTAISTDFM